MCLARGRSFSGGAGVGALELAQVQQRRAAERQHEGVEVDRGQPGRSAAPAVSGGDAGRLLDARRAVLVGEDAPVGDRES